jgi:membrane associated rhomboid family serine protease
MIIVPTEKQFDWRHAPIVLFLIVLLNLLTYFLYQSRDTAKWMDVATTYQAHEFFDKEWPAFKRYLKEKNEQELLAKYEQAYKKKNVEIIIQDLLSRQDFYKYLEHNSREYFLPDDHDIWAPERARINAVIQTISYMSNGLIANQLQVFDFISHQFLHGSLDHLLGNMFFLIICGFAVEAAIGHWRFLAFYLLSGIGAGFAQVASDWNSSVPLIGASGAISGVMAMYLAVFRFKKIEFFYWFFFFVGYFRAPALLILPFYIGKEIYSFYQDTESNVAFMAHAGGFVTGAVLIGASLLFNRSMLNRDYLDTDQSVDPKQAQLADIYDCISKFRFEKALTSVEDMIKEYKMTFDLGLIRYNLLKINRGEIFDKAALDLFKLPHLSPTELKRLNTIWIDNPQIHQNIDEQTAIKAASQLATITTSPKAAEDLFQLLQERKTTHSSMGIIANRLARTFSQLRDQSKTHYYERAARQYSETSHGLL